MAARSSWLFSLQTKLILAFALLAIVALAIAGSSFVAVRRGDEQREALDHVIAASPAISNEFFFLERNGSTTGDLSEFVKSAAAELDVRALVVERGTGLVALDSEGDLTGKQLSLPRQAVVGRPTRARPYISWRPADGTPGSGLILVSTLATRAVTAPSDPYGLLFAVPKETITGAWRGLLPQFGIAAAIALPIAALLGILVAAYISRPLRKLTVASQRIAEGTFDVDVSVDRSDEVGLLAQSFSTMASRVGEAHAQMRSLVANVSHDLKTPLTSILGFAQALRDGGAQAEADTKRMGSVIYDEAARLNLRLDELLYLAELESGQMVLQHDEIDLDRLAGAALDRIAADATARGVEVTRELQPQLTVPGDGARLERAIENLLDNARKYTPSGGEIRVRTYTEGGRACIEVANTALDMSEEELPRLFERFYRRDRPRGPDSARGGSGLGLAIARELVELHGGALDAALRQGEIAFTIRLPVSAG